MGKPATRVAIVAAFMFLSGPGAAHAAPQASLTISGGQLIGDQLVFVAGDRQVSGEPADDVLGAGEVFSARLLDGDKALVANVSLTSGQRSPPFDVPGQLDVEWAMISPTGDFLLLADRALGDDEGDRLVAVPLTDQPSGAREVVAGMVSAPEPPWSVSSPSSPCSVSLPDPPSSMSAPSAPTSTS